MKRSTPVEVTGMGCVSGAGLSASASVKSLYSGERNPRPPRRFSSDHRTKSPVFEIPDDGLPAWLPPEETLLRTGRLALAAAAEALEDARWDPEALRELRVGICVGTTVGSAMNNEEFYREYREGGTPAMNPITRFLGSNPASAIAARFGFSGPCQTVVNACSSGTDAVGIAAMWLNAGHCDIAIAGGADELCRVTYNGFSSLMITDEEPCRPFDRNRRGLNLGEGAAMVVLEREGFSRERQAGIRGRILGYGSACDAHHLTAPRPDGRGLRKALETALGSAGLSARDIAFVNAHGTGTADNDLVEGKVLHDVLPGVPFFSTKGLTGHTLGAAGAIEAVFTLLSLAEGRIPGSSGFMEEDPAIPAPPLVSEEPVRGEAALSQSLAFGGNNSVLVLGRGET